MNLFMVIILIGQENNSWGYHSDNGYFFYPSRYDTSKYGMPHGPSFTTGDTIGCCINFLSNMIFYTKNGVHLGGYYYFNTN